MIGPRGARHRNNAEEHFRHQQRLPYRTPWDAGLRVLKGRVPVGCRALPGPAASYADSPLLLTGRSHRPVSPPEPSYRYGDQGLERQGPLDRYHCPSGSADGSSRQQLQPSKPFALCLLLGRPRCRRRRHTARHRAGSCGRATGGIDAEEGRIILDREILPVSLPAGTTPILVKVFNRRDFRICSCVSSPVQKPMPGLQFGPRPD